MSFLMIVLFMIIILYLFDFIEVYDRKIVMMASCIDVIVKLTGFIRILNMIRLVFIVIFVVIVSVIVIFVDFINFRYYSNCLDFPLHFRQLA